MGNAKQFRLSLAKFAKKSRRDVAELVIIGANVAMGGLVRASPFDTGRFRSSWFVGIGAADRRVVPTGGDFNEAESINRLQILEDTNKVEQELLVVLSNNLPYAVGLAEGRSPQRASGWIDVILRETQAELDKVKFT